jgi:hypothetical protein
LAAISIDEHNRRKRMNLPCINAGRDVWEILAEMVASEEAEDLAVLEEQQQTIPPIVHYSPTGDAVISNHWHSAYLPASATEWIISYDAAYGAKLRRADVALLI